MSIDEKPTKKPEDAPPRGGLKMFFDPSKMTDEEMAKMVELTEKALEATETSKK